jgi:hypothetical protein
VRLFSVYPGVQRVKFGLGFVHVGDGSKSDEFATPKPLATDDVLMKKYVDVSGCV